MAHPAGLEPTALCSGGIRSIRVSYGCVYTAYYNITLSLWQPFNKEAGMQKILFGQAPKLLTLHYDASIIPHGKKL